MKRTIKMNHNLTTKQKVSFEGEKSNVQGTTNKN
jgi:hypothetical protein